MTALCGGGASQPKAGVAETIIYTAGALASLLNNKGGLWASIAAPLLGVLSYEATSLCNTDPPPLVDFTQAEYLALLNLSPWDTLQDAIGKLAAHVTNAVWYDLCECASTTTPASPPAVLAPPPGVQVQPSARGPCVVRTWQQACHIAAGTAIEAPSFINTQMFPELAVVAKPNCFPHYFAHNASAWPSPSWSRWRVRAQLVSAGNPPSGKYRVEAGSETGFGCQQPTFIYNLPVTAPSDYMDWPNGYAITPATYTDFSIAVQQTGGTVPGVVQVTVELDCDDVGGLTQQCCPPDPTIVALLQQLLEAATTQQRWRLPFGTLSGSSHVCSGEGSFTVSRLLGLDLDVSTLPPGHRTATGNPDYIFDLGWVAVDDGAAMLQEQRVAQLHRRWFPQQMQLATTVSYALADGVVLNVTEISVEP